MSTFTTEFEELPLITEDGFEAGLVNGSAVVSYHENGEWFVHTIHLDGAKWNGKTGKYDRKSVPLDERSWLYLAIWGTLSDPGRYFDRISEEVEKRMNEDGISIPDPNAEHRLSRAQLGV